LEGGRARSLPHPFEQARPQAPGNADERIASIAAQEQRIVLAKPFFDGGEASAILAGFHLSDDRGLANAERINVNVMTGAAKSARARKRVPFGMDADRLMPIDDFSFDIVAFAPMAGAAGTDTFVFDSHFSLPFSPLQVG
jgi:hypothetical protein